jgi:hypothetical protein
VGRSAKGALLLMVQLSPEGVARQRAIRRSVAHQVAINLIRQFRRWHYVSTMTPLSLAVGSSWTSVFPIRYRASSIVATGNSARRRRSMLH